MLLFPLDRLGPLRQGALAELLHADPSTVSRHVALLVERGLVRRVADESDGRASRLVVTDAGRAALEQLGREREAFLAHVTADWADDRPRHLHRPPRAASSTTSPPPCPAPTAPASPPRRVIR